MLKRSWTIKTIAIVRLITRSSRACSIASVGLSISLAFSSTIFYFFFLFVFKRREQEEEEVKEK